MKIIKQGALPEEKPYQTVCYRCRTEFEFMENEGEVIFSQREDDQVKVSCPHCGHHCYERLHKA